ncbi:MAG: hypothetical protein AAF004_05390 [Pseudomonadota bacterium]
MRHSRTILITLLFSFALSIASNAEAGRILIRSFETELNTSASVELGGVTASQSTSARTTEFSDLTIISRADVDVPDNNENPTDRFSRVRFDPSSDASNVFWFLRNEQALSDGLDFAVTGGVAEATMDLVFSVHASDSDLRLLSFFGEASGVSRLNLRNLSTGEDVARLALDLGGLEEADLNIDLVNGSTYRLRGFFLNNSTQDDDLVAGYDFDGANVVAVPTPGAALLFILAFFGSCAGRLYHQARA